MIYITDRGMNIMRSRYSYFCFRYTLENLQRGTRIWKEGWLHVSNFGESRIVNPGIHYSPEMRPSLVLVSVYVTLVIIMELDEIPRIFKSFMFWLTYDMPITIFKKRWVSSICNFIFAVDCALFCSTFSFFNFIPSKLKSSRESSKFRVAIDVNFNGKESFIKVSWM